MSPEERDDLEAEWVCEIGTQPPAFGADTLREHLDDLRSLPWSAAVKWAELIVGRKLLPSETRRLQGAQGFLAFGNREKKRTAVLRRAGNGLRRTVQVAKPGHSVEDLAEFRDTGRDPFDHNEGNWARVNGCRPGLNRHNLRLQDGARLRRHRLLRYCEASFAAAQKKGAVFSLKRVFSAGSARIFGRPQPYANRSRNKALRDFIEAELARKNVTHPPGRALIVTPGAMGYGSTEPTKDFGEITHRPGAGAEGPLSNAGQAGENVPLAAFGGHGAAPPVPPEGRCPSRLSPGPTPCSVGSKGAPASLVGLASSALPTLRAAHGAHDSILWSRSVKGSGWARDGQRGWAKGWLVAWLQRGRSAADLVRLYLEQLAWHDFRAKQSGFAAGQFMPWGMRKRLQQLAEQLPAHSAEHYQANPARFAPTPGQLALVKFREERKAQRIAAAKLPRVRRKSPATVSRMLEEVFRDAPVVEQLEPEKPEWLQRIEDDLADMAAESAAFAMDRRNERGAEREKYLAAYNAANAEGDWTRARRILNTAEAVGITL